jgi:predicted RNA-binding Zn-ribbon protein involved in translation (DUF1610 family)
MEHVCPKCDHLLTRCSAPIEGSTGPELVVEPRKFFRRSKAAFATPYVCTNCGYIEWYVADPAKLR